MDTLLESLADAIAMDARVVNHGRSSGSTGFSASPPSTKQDTVDDMLPPREEHFIHMLPPPITVRFLTLNCWCLPETIAPATKRRSARLAAALAGLAAAPNAPDVIALQECFTQRSVDTFAAALAPHYPHFALAPRGAPGAGRCCAAVGRFCLCCLPRGTCPVGCGLVLASRWPIADARFLPYSGAIGSEVCAGKGALCARIVVPSGNGDSGGRARTLVVATTHTQADPDPACPWWWPCVRGDKLARARRVRDAQFAALGAFVRTQMAHAGVRAAVVLGDLNEPSYAWGDPSRSDAAALPPPPPPPQPRRPRVICVGIAGATRSGKTTLAAALARASSASGREGSPVRSLSLDDFRAFTLLGRRVVDAEGRRDWETPDNIAFDELVAAIEAAAADAASAASAASAEDAATTAAGLVVVEGFCLLADPRVAALLDLVLVVDVDEATCRERRARTCKRPAPDAWQDDAEGYFAQRIWPRHLERQREIAALAADAGAPRVETLDGAAQTPARVAARAAALVRAAGARLGLGALPLGDGSGIGPDGVSVAIDDPPPPPPPPLPLAARYTSMLSLLAGSGGRVAVEDAHLAAHAREAAADPGFTCDHRSNPNLPRGGWNSLSRLDYGLVFTAKTAEDAEESEEAARLAAEATAEEGGGGDGGNGPPPPAVVVESCRVNRMGALSDHFGVEVVCEFS